MKLVGGSILEAVEPIRALWHSPPLPLAWMPVPAFVPAIALVLALLCAAVVFFTYRRLSGARRFAVVLALLRIAMLVSVGALVWKAFWGRTLVVDYERVERLPPELVVLQDDSASMTMHAGGRQSRKELAEDVFLDAESEARRRGWSVRRFFFGGNVVPEEDAVDLDRTASEMSQAFQRVLSRQSCRSLLVLSDGAVTDTPPPPYLRDWVRNRRVRLGGVCTTATSDVVDRAVRARVADGAGGAPTAIHATVTSHGRIQAPMTIECWIDGRRVETMERPAAPEQTVVFELPYLKTGWHVYQVRVLAVAGELTERNNRVGGTFRRPPRFAIGLVFGTPRVEYRHLARVLRAQYSDRFSSIAVTRLTESDRRLEGYSVLLVGDGTFAGLSVAQRRAVLARATPTLFLASQELQSWSTLAPYFPVLSYVDGPPSGSAMPRDGAVVVPELTRSNEFIGGLEALAGKTLTVVPVTTARPGPRVLELSGQTGRRPLLVCDALTRPRRVAFLCDSTWRWARSSDPDLRRGHDLLWTTLVEWLRGVPHNGSSLRLQLEELDSQHLRGTVSSTDPELRNVGVDVRINVGNDGHRAPLPLEEATTWQGERRWRFKYRPRADDQPADGGHWFQARGQNRHGEVKSDAVPHVFQPDLREFERPLPRLSSLAACLGGGTVSEPSGATASSTRVANYAGRREVLDSLFPDEAASMREVTTLRRDTVWELVLAVWVSCLWGGEWWLERRLRRRRKSA